MTVTGREPVAVATGLFARVIACYRKRFRISVELLFGQSATQAKKTEWLN
ncbi:MAG: hypothetical protein QOF63_4159 [Thermoanaerobaculia bacterium]|jgi:hypothetical protein|nr:hypothetical protein [Thermoanaerobaculia bacterium]